MSSEKLKKSVRALLVLFVVIASMFLLKYTFVYIYPFIIILLIAVFLHPIVSYLERKWKLSRGFATLLVMSSFFSLFILFSYILFVNISQEALVLLDGFPAKLAQVKSLSLAFMQYIYDHIISHFPVLRDWHIQDDIDTLIDKLTGLSLDFLKSIIFTSTEIINSISYIGFISVFIFIAVYMVTKDLIPFKNQCKKLLPNRVVELIQMILINVKYAITGLVKAQIIITLLSTILIFFGLLVFRTEHLIMITLIIFVVDFIPYLGIGIILIPWILYSFFSHDYTSSIQLSLLYGCVILFRQILEPKLIADKIGIHPFVALSILFLGIQLFGVIGIFITPLFLIIISALYKAGIFKLVWTFINEES